MFTTQTSPDLLDRHFLDIRCDLLDLAAALDRLERAPGFAGVANDPRLQNIRRGIQILQESGSDRAEHLQLLFSDHYVPDWQNGDV